MKNRIIIAALFIISGLLVILGPTALFPVCSAEKMKMACYYTSKAEIGLGSLIGVLGIVYFFFKDKGVRLGLSIAQLANAVLILLYPLALTGLCGKEDMDCRVGTLPALIVLSVVLGVTAIVNILFFARSKKQSA